jgi:hypothetical protein
MLPASSRVNSGVSELIDPFVTIGVRAASRAAAA